MDPLATHDMPHGGCAHESGGIMAHSCGAQARGCHVPICQIMARRASSSNPIPDRVTTPPSSGRSRRLATCFPWLIVLCGSLGVACDGEDPTIDLGPPAPPLVLPDMTGLDMASSLQKGLELSLTADLRQPWIAFEETLELGVEGCPDLYAPSSGDDREATGPSWRDACQTPGGTAYEGELAWATTASSQAEDSDPTSAVSFGTRTLEGSATVTAPNGLLLGFSGTGSDSFYQSTGTDYLHWTYSTEIRATVTGSMAFQDGSGFQGGWREDLYLYYSGGDQDQIELRGDLFLLQDTFDRFDSVSMDLTLQGPIGAAPDTCQLEPYGYLGLRDTSAYWYEVIFLPGDSNTTDPVDGICDGCGTLFVRGVEQEGQVCLPFDWLWERLSAPVLADYIYSTRL